MVISQDLKAERRQRDELEMQVKTALREAEDIKTQARADQETALKLAVRAEALQKQFAAIVQDLDQSDTARDAAVAPTRASPLASMVGEKALGQAKRPPIGATAMKRSIRRTARLFSGSVPLRKNVNRAQTMKLGYKLASRNAFVLPSALRPIRF